MDTSHSPPAQYLWHLLTRLGEAQILLPVMAAMLAWLVFHPTSRPLAWRWCTGTAAAALLTTGTKVAFIGFGWGLASIDFTGFSGHAMFSAAILPWLLALLPLYRRPRVTGLDLLPGAGLALLIAVSRVEVGAHSWSEVVLGGLLGWGISLWTLAVPGGAQRPTQVSKLAVALTTAWLLLLPVHAPASHSHGWVTSLSLRIARHSHPYTREHLQREQHRSQFRPHADMASLAPRPARTA
ncbi:phosphatase PAP2 family protein [Sphaerotilus sp.]|uniref:phosphatase PAP2 family protein n=1 Tax=Sphaerotilus sp. TaxID=2093942 RepID=UPI0034E1EAEE